MKVEKDNACDRVDVCDEQCKAAKIRASKAEDEVDELMTKSRQLETELDMTAERLSIATLQLEEKEKQLAATELEMNALTRRVSGPEGGEGEGRGRRCHLRRGCQEACHLRVRPRAGGGAEGCGQQPQVPGGGRGEGQPEGEDLQGADQDPDCQAEAGRGPCRVR